MCMVCDILLYTTSSSTFAFFAFFYVFPPSALLFSLMPLPFSPFLPISPPCLPTTTRSAEPSAVLAYCQRCNRQTMSHSLLSFYSLLCDLILLLRSTYGHSAGRSSSRRGMRRASSSSQRWSDKSHAPWAFRWGLHRWSASRMTGSRLMSTGSSSISMIG